MVLIESYPRTLIAEEVVAQMERSTIHRVEKQNCSDNNGVMTSIEVYLRALRVQNR